MIRISSSVFLAAFLLHCPASSQVVLPSGFANRSGNWFDSSATNASYLPTRTQLGYDPSEVGTSTAVIRTVAFRRSNGIPLVNPAMKVELQLSISHGGREPDRLSTTFGDNVGPDNKVVFRGSVNWPRSEQSSSVPKFLARVPLQSTFVFDRTKGKSLVLDLVIRKQDDPQRRPWILDGAIRDDGRATRNGDFPKSPCMLEYGLNDSIVIGRPWRPAGSDLPPFAIGVFAFGFAGAGSRWGSLLLPIDMAPLGARGCFWAVAPAAWIPFAVDPSGKASVGSLPIPFDRNLVDQHVFDQGVLIDPVANPLGLRTMRSMKRTIGSGYVPAATVVRGPADLRSGFSLSNWAIIVELGL